MLLHARSQTDPSRTEIAGAGSLHTNPPRVLIPLRPNETTIASFQPNPVRFHQHRSVRTFRCRGNETRKQCRSANANRDRPRPFAAHGRPARGRDQAPRMDRRAPLWKHPHLSSTSAMGIRHRVVVALETPSRRARSPTGCSRKWRSACPAGCSSTSTTTSRATGTDASTTRASMSNCAGRSRSGQALGKPDALRRILVRRQALGAGRV